MSGLLGKFSLKEFDEFFNNYKVKNTLSVTEHWGGKWTNKIKYMYSPI